MNAPGAGNAEHAAKDVNSDQPAVVSLDLVDVHTHLAAGEFDADREQVLHRAREAGVAAIVLVAEALQDAERNLELAAQYPILKPCAGLYPATLDRAAADAMVAFVREHAADWVGIGEVGLDYWLAKTPQDRELQREILRRFVALSLELDLPLNVHSRSAGAETIALLKDSGATRVLLHAFDGKASRAEAALELGYCFSIPPSVVRSSQKQKLVRKLPLEHLLLETDSPVLGPEPGVRNEPANLRLVVREVARIKGVPAELVARKTTENALRLFPKLRGTLAG